MKIILLLLLILFIAYLIRNINNINKKIKGIVQGDKILSSSIDIILNSINNFVSFLIFPFSCKKRKILKAKCKKYKPKYESGILDSIKTNNLYYYRYKIFWSLFVLYALYSVIMTVCSSPIDANTGEPIPYIKNVIYNYGLLTFLVFINALTDITSIFITLLDFKLAKKALDENKVFRAIKFVFLDCLYASCIFIFSQLVSNFLYLFPIGQHNQNLYDTTFSFETPFFPYAFVNPIDRLNGNGINIACDFIFPGQLVLTGTILYPTLFAILLIFSLVIMVLLVKLMISIFGKPSHQENNADGIGGKGFIIKVANEASKRCTKHFINLAIGVVIASYSLVLSIYVT